MSGTGGGRGPNGGAGYSQPFYPAGQTAPQTFMYYNPHNVGSNAAFDYAATELNFAIISGISLVISPDDVMSGVVPQLQYLFANLPAGKTYRFCVHMPFSSLTGSSYPFAVRQMNVAYAGRNPAAMQVPILSPTNGPLVIAYYLQLITALQNIFNAAGSRFVLYALGLALTSEVGYDAEFTVPSDVSETSAQAIANWSTYGVTEANLTTFLQNFILAVAQGSGAGKILTLPFLNPDASSVGQNNDGGVSYTSHVNGMTNALFNATGQQFYVNDQSLSLNNTTPERPEIVSAANYSGAYVCQFIGNVVLSLAFPYILQRQATWIEIGASLLNDSINLGWNGSAFVALGAGQSCAFVT